MHILFFDGCTPKPYTYTTLADEAMGGTEATVLRLTHALCNLGHEVIIKQRTRTLYEGTPPLYYSPWDEQKISKHNSEKVDVIINLRRPELVSYIAATYPGIPQILWCHDWFSANRQHLEDISYYNVPVIGVSETHAKQIREAITAVGYTDIPVSYIYNPISDHLKPDATIIDPKKLIFFSSPHKGLDQALEIFIEHIYSKDSEFKLYISNPGYYPNKETNKYKGVVNLGAIPHSQAIDHVRTALCVFYPNTVFPETFGLIFAEANAINRPVIAHDFGAAKEVLAWPEHQLIDCTKPEVVSQRVFDYYSLHQASFEAYYTNKTDNYRLTATATKWEKLLHESLLY